jgi:methionyl aminopeptidase
MDADVLEKYRKAGKILSQVLAEAAPKVQVGASLLEVAELVEGATRELGGEPAFPCNISLNRIAAHYSPGPDDESVFGEDMVKLDVGVHVDGYIADAAVTVDLSGHPDMVDASRAALDDAIELVAPGVSTATIGAAIESTIEGYGYKPVGNLTGHGLERYSAHAEPTVPNKAWQLEPEFSLHWRCDSNRALCYRWHGQNHRGALCGDIRVFRKKACQIQRGQRAFKEDTGDL